MPKAFYALNKCYLILRDAFEYYSGASIRQRAAEMVSAEIKLMGFWSRGQSSN